MRPLPLLAALLAFACAPAEDDDTVDETDETDETDDTGPAAPAFLTSDLALVADLTPDGTVALLQDPASLTAEVWLLDTVTGEATLATALGDATRNQATGLSADLAISALKGADPTYAGLWSEADGWLDLPSPFDEGCGPDVGGAFDLDDAGEVVVGLMWEGCAPAAFRWTADGGTLILDRLGEAPEGSLAPPTNRATVVSGDGQVVAGFAAYGLLDRSPAWWTADGSGALLDPDETEVPGEVLAIDHDGDTLAGVRGADGWVWTEADGFTPIDRTETALPSDPVFPNALTADGARVFGGVGSEFFGVPVAFVWSADGGTRAVQPLLVEAGLEIPEGWSLTTVLAVSDDGTVLLGRAFDADFAPKAWVARVPAGTWD